MNDFSFCDESVISQCLCGTQQEYCESDEACVLSGKQHACKNLSMCEQDTPLSGHCTCSDAPRSSQAVCQPGQTCSNGRCLSGCDQAWCASGTCYNGSCVRFCQGGEPAGTLCISQKKGASETADDIRNCTDDQASDCRCGETLCSKSQYCANGWCNNCNTLFEQCGQCQNASVCTADLSNNKFARDSCPAGFYYKAAKCYRCSLIFTACTECESEYHCTNYADCPAEGFYVDANSQCVSCESLMPRCIICNANECYRINVNGSNKFANEEYCSIDGYKFDDVALACVKCQDCRYNEQPKPRTTLVIAFSVLAAGIVIATPFVIACCIKYKKCPCECTTRRNRWSTAKESSNPSGKREVKMYDAYKDVSAPNLLVAKM